MIREVIATGRDVNTAIDNGCAELGIDRDNAQFEIISLPKKGFLGLKTYPAKVKVFEELPDLPKPAPKPAAVQQSAPSAKSAPLVQPPRPAAPRTEPAPAPRPKQPAPAQQQTKPAMEQPRPIAPKPPHNSTKPAVRLPKDDAVHTTGAVENNEDMGEPIPQVEIVPAPEVREKVERAAEYLAEMMRAMGFETIEVTPAYYSENVCLRLSGAQLGVVIGRRGETLDALQYLTSLVANRGDGEYIRVNIDSGNYREKREKTLTALARKLALQAIRSGKSTTLEPMNPYERRVIHGAVSQIRGAVSTSVGADPNRRVVISAADAAKKTGEAPAERGRTGGDRGGRGRSGDRRDQGGKDNRPKAPNAPRTPLRPNTNTAESVAAAKNAVDVVRIDELKDGPTATFVATRAAAPSAAPKTHTEPWVQPTAQAVPAPVPAPVPHAPAAPARKLSDAEMFGDIPMGVPIISGDRPAAPKSVEKKPQPKPEPKKIDGELYGKI